MMVWQRGSLKQQVQDDPNNKRILRSRAIKPDALQKFQKLDHATLSSGQRPSPSFLDEMIDAEKWLTNNAEIQKARSKDLAWMVSRKYDDDQSAPEWRALNEAISINDPLVATAEMLPILQAPANNNDTRTTLINRFLDISTCIGQTHTIITADLPLYSRGKELVWANPKFEDVVFLMGALHVCFNF